MAEGLMVAQDERLVPLTSAGALVEEFSGTPASRTTIYRWADTGICGVRLRTICIGAHRRTSAKWLREFFDRVTAAKDAERASAV